MIGGGDETCCEEGRTGSEGAGGVGFSSSDASGVYIPPGGGSCTGEVDGDDGEARVGVLARMMPASATAGP